MSERVLEWTFKRIFQAWDYVRIEGVVKPGGAEIDYIELTGADHSRVAGGRAALSAGDHGSKAVQLLISCLSDDALVLADCFLKVGIVGESAPVYEGLGDYVQQWLDFSNAPPLKRFRDLVAAHPAARVLEIGGRDRSGVSHRSLIGPVHEYVGLDILPGEGADVVADAHVMSGVLGRDRFDFACSYSVFEHLAMPWKVVIELNHVLVDGAYALIMAPQACGLHDVPWDYFRFSDSAFRALFAPETGFEVVDVTHHNPMHIFPFVSRRRDTKDELVAGFFTVIALVRKTGPSTLEWSADPQRIVDAPYPE